SAGAGRSRTSGAPEQSPQARQEASLRLEPGVGHVLAPDAPGDVAEGAAGTHLPAAVLERQGVADVRRDDDLLVLRHDADELHAENLEDVVDLEHVAALDHLG